MVNFKRDPFFSFQDKSESSENECNKKDEYESPASSTGWTGFNGSGSVAMTGHLAGLLAQNGQNGGSSSVNIFFIPKFYSKNQIGITSTYHKKGKIST